MERRASCDLSGEIDLITEADFLGCGMRSPARCKFSPVAFSYLSRHHHGMRCVPPGAPQPSPRALVAACEQPAAYPEAGCPLFCATVQDGAKGAGTGLTGEPGREDLGVERGTGSRRRQETLAGWQARSVLACKQWPACHDNAAQEIGQMVTVRQ